MAIIVVVAVIIAIVFIIVVAAIIIIVVTVIVTVIVAVIVAVIFACWILLDETQLLQLGPDTLPNLLNFCFGKPSPDFCLLAFLI